MTHYTSAGYSLTRAKGQAGVSWPSSKGGAHNLGVSAGHSGWPLPALTPAPSGQNDSWQQRCPPCPPWQQGRGRAVMSWNLQRGIVGELPLLGPGRSGEPMGELSPVRQMHGQSQAGESEGEDDPRACSKSSGCKGGRGGSSHTSADQRCSRPAIGVPSSLRKWGHPKDAMSLAGENDGVRRA